MTAYIGFSITYGHKVYTPIILSIIGLIFQIIDNECAFDRFDTIQNLRKYIPLHAFWHVFVTIGLTNLVRMKYNVIEP